MKWTLPSGWRWVSLPEVAAINPKGWRVPPKDNEAVSFVPMASVEEGSGRLDPTTARPWREVKKGYTTFEEGDILFAKVTPCMENGKCAMAVGLAGGRGAGSTEFFVFRPTTVSPKYLLHFLLWESFRREARGAMQGVAGLLRVRKEFIESASLPLPPMQEQGRIVAEIEKQFTRLDAGVAALKRLHLHLRRYRASVLKAACEGRLLPTEGGLSGTGEPGPTATEYLRGHGIQPSPQTKAERLPSGWTWTSLADLKQFSMYGPRFSSDDYRAEGRLVLRTSDISESGKVNTATAPRLPLSDAEFLKYRVERGDLLITRTGSLGTLAVFDDDVDAIAGAYLIQYRLKVPHATSRYVFTFLKSPSGQAQLVRGGAGVGRPNLNAPTIEAISIPLPPPAEQQSILMTVEEKLSQADAVEAGVEASLARAARLRSTVLRAAFEGRLGAPERPARAHTA
jgi:type I restriction enzyme S subunit